MLNSAYSIGVCYGLMTHSDTSVSLFAALTRLDIIINNYLMLLNGKL